MIVFPNSKINLGLHILQKRNDGFHDLETVFYPLAFQEGLEMVQQMISTESTEISISGIDLGPDPRDNISLKAYRLLKNDFPDLPAMKIHLHKAIPAGAGLGGGSADGAFSLLLINKKFDLGLSEDQLLHYALTLGSDCPFFIRNQPCIGSGRGELMEQVEVDLDRYVIVIINPGIHISTAWAFSGIRPSSSRIPLAEIIKNPIQTWKDSLKNDFEGPVFEAYPEIKEIKEALYGSGAIYASLSGSGSTVYGLFEQKPAPQLHFPSSYFIRHI